MVENPYESPEFPGDKPLPQKKGWFSCLGCFLILVFAGVVAGLLLPGMRRGMPEAARRSQCQNNLKQLALALHLYESVHKTLPSAFTTDADGKPLHSWRALILPYVEQQALFDSIDFSKPWNDPANAGAYKKLPEVFQCPSVRDLEPGFTTYLAVVGEDCSLHPTRPRQLQEFKDGQSNTLMLVDVTRNMAVHWMSPTDADETMVLELGKHQEDRTNREARLHHLGKFNAARCDRSVQIIDGSYDENSRRALITIAGDDNDSISDDQY